MELDLIDLRYLSTAPGVGVGGVTGPPQADLHHPAAVQQPLLHTASEGGPVSDPLPQNHITGVSVSVNVDQTHRAVPAGNHRVLQSITEYHRVLQSITEYYRVLQSTTEYYRVLQSTTEYYRVTYISDLFLYFLTF